MFLHVRVKTNKYWNSKQWKHKKTPRFAKAVVSALFYYDPAVTVKLFEGVVKGGGGSIGVC